MKLLKEGQTKRLLIKIMTMWMAEEIKKRKKRNTKEMMRERRIVISSLLQLIQLKIRILSCKKSSKGIQWSTLKLKDKFFKIMKGHSVTWKEKKIELLVLNVKVFSKNFRWHWVMDRIRNRIQMQLNQIILWMKTILKMVSILKW